jgi:predicted TIM-barrel fold metal-dependent hydrolase
MTFPMIVSPDDHLVEPPHLWVDRLPTKYADVMPRVRRLHGVSTKRDDVPWFEECDGPEAGWADVWCYEDKRVVTTQAAAAVGYDRDEIRLLNPLTFDDMRPGLYQPSARLADMDLGGVEASLCFPNVFVRFCGQQFLWAKDKELALFCVRAYNDFVVDEWCAGSGGRLIPCGIVPLWDADLAAEEIQRNAARGIRTVTFSELPPYLGLPSIHTDYWDPFFRACEETSTVVAVHVGSSSQLPMTSVDAPAAVIHALPANNSAAALVDWICGAMPVRFPGLKYLMAECNIGWIPYYLGRLDVIWDHNRAYTGIAESLPNPPSSYFKDHIFCTFFNDAFGLRQLSEIGEDNVMFETDYPHGDSTWPHSIDVVRQQAEAAGLSSQTTEKVVRGNAARLFGLDP